MPQDSTEPASYGLTDPYRIESITPAQAPSGSTGLWHRYVITQGPNTITGLRPGTLAEITPLLGLLVEQLNLRRAGKRAT